MDLGFVSLNTPRDLGPDVLARELESRGFESLWVGEHPQIPVAAAGQFHPALLKAQKQIRDPLLSLMMAAQVTTTLRLGTAVALPLEHELFTLAKQVATLDHMSGGRLLFGVGVGARAEFEVATRIAWPARYRALGDMIGALDALWRDDESEHHGSEHHGEFSTSTPCGRTPSRTSGHGPRCWPPRPARTPSVNAWRGPTGGCPAMRQCATSSGP